MSRSRPSGLARALWVALLLCVLGMRVVVPQGFMWASDGDGSPRMVFCSGSGPLPQLPAISAKAVAAQQRSDHPAEDGKTVDHPCAFATAQAAVDLAGLAYPGIARPVAHEAPITQSRAARPGLGLAAPPPPKTGPPSLA